MATAPTFPHSLRRPLAGHGASNRGVEILGLAWALGLALGIGLTDSPLFLAPLLAPLVFLAACRWPIPTVVVAVAAVPLELAPVHNITPTQALLMAAAGGWLVAQLRERRWTLPTTPVLWPSALLVLSVAPGLLLAGDAYSVFQRLLTWGVFLVLLVAVARDATRDDVRNILRAAAFAGMIASLLAILGVGITEVDSVSGVATDRSGGPFPQVNALAAFLVMTIPVQFVLAVQGGKIERPLAGLAFVISCVGLATSLSRGGFIGLAVVAVLMLSWGPARRFALVVVVALVLLVASGVSLKVGRFDAATFVSRAASTGNASGATKTGRLAIYKAAPHIIADHPLFGVGARNLKSVAPRYGLTNVGFTGPYANVHSTFLAIVVEHGVFGALALLAVALSAIGLVSRLYREAPPQDRPLVLGMGAALVGLAAVGTIHDLLPSVPIIGVAFVFLGCLSALDRSSRDAPA